MCGIAGAFNLNWDNIENTFIEQLNHRGPEKNGFWKDDTVILAHTRLKIIDLSDEANQPMLSSCKRYIIVFNGEIYNYLEIANEIQKERNNFTFRTKSDTEVIIEAFALWGKNMVNKLNGMFAIAIYDKHEKKLYLFRDRLGVKPLFYTKVDSSYIFASELKAITELKNIKAALELNYEAVNLYFHLGYIPAPLTIWKNIFKFPQGNYAEISESNITILPYWELIEKIKLNNHCSYLDAKNELHALLKSSVNLRMISDVPFGTLLSGGIDSSLITSIAASQAGSSLNTFTIGFNDKKHDESLWASKIANHLNTNHHELFVSEKDALNLVPEIISIYDEPYADSSAIPTLLVSQLSKKHVTMVLSGDGGDELFMGYGAYKWAKRFNNSTFYLFRQLIASVLRYGRSRHKRAALLINHAKSNNIYSHIFSQEQYLFSEKELKKILSISTNYSVNIFDDTKLINNGLLSEEKQAIYDLLFYLPDDLLVKVDRAAMYYALETRVPMLDYRVVEYAINLPASYKRNNSSTKIILKDILHEYVPEEFFNRPKQGFSVPLASWLNGPLKDMLNTYINKDSLSKYNIYNVQEILNYKHKFENGHNHYYNRIWQVLIMQMFLEKNGQ